MDMDSGAPIKEAQNRSGAQNGSLASLMEHIVQTHHAYCRRELAELETLFKETIQKHGSSHAELKQVHDLFLQMARDLLKHMAKEEDTLFPYIARVEEAVAKEIPVDWPLFGTVGNPIRIMVVEHVKTDDELGKMRELSNGFTAADDADEAYQSLYERLTAFDADMQRHIQCENDDLFPRAVALEEEACNRQETAKR